MIQKNIKIQIPTGLEARPVAVLVQIASKYESSIFIESGTKKVNAKSIMGMMALGLETDEEITVIAEGSDEEEAVKGMETGEALAQAVGKGALEEVNPRSSWRASREFRLQLVEELGRRAVKQAVINAGGEWDA